MRRAALFCIVLSSSVSAETVTESDIAAALARPDANEPAVVRVREAYAAFTQTQAAIQRRERLQEQIQSITRKLADMEELRKSVESAQAMGMRWYTPEGKTAEIAQLKADSAAIQSEANQLIASTQPATVEFWESGVTPEEVSKQVDDLSARAALAKQRAMDPAKPLNDDDRQRFADFNQQILDRLRRDEAIPRMQLKVLTEALAQSPSVAAPDAPVLLAHQQQLDAAYSK